MIATLWWRVLGRAALIPLPVLAPLIALAPLRDHRFNLYWHGGLFRDEPWRIVPHTAGTMPGYLRLGNFRLLGRMVEKGLDTAAYAISEVLGVPVNVGFRALSFLAAVLLCVSAVLLAESLVARGPLFRRAPSTLAVTVPFAVAVGFVAAGGASPAVLFGGLYYTSAAVVLLVAALLCRVSPEQGPRARWILPLMVGGAALAAFNEITYLAVPLATVAVLVRGWLVLGLDARTLFTGAPARAVGLLWLGFLPVFVAVRVAIHRFCSTGECYQGSDVSLGPAVVEALPVRLISWFTPLLWRGATTGSGDRPWITGAVLVGALLVLAVLAGHAMRDLPLLSAPGRRGGLAVVAAGATLVALGAAMASLNVDVQKMVATGNWGQGWRDTAATTTAGALVVAGAVHLVRGKRFLPLLLIALLATGGSVSAAANKRFRDVAMARPEAVLSNRIAQEMADFDRSPAGAVRRCALRAEFFAMHERIPFSLTRFDASLDTAARQRSGRPFCPGAGERPGPGRSGVTAADQGR